MSFKRLASGFTWIAMLVLALAACGGSGTSIDLSTDCSHPSPSDVNGCTFVNITDAPGDFLTYTVDVTGLTLKRKDGTVVNVLPQTTTVDFAQYADLDEFLTAADMPLGAYTSGTVTLDYSDADIEVQDNSGKAVKVMPVDQNGNPVTALTLSIQWDDGALVLAPGIPKVFQLDFNLAASNVVDLTAGTVTVAPFLVADVDPNFDNKIRVRGPLDAVDTAKGDFTLGLRPFDMDRGDFGQMGIFTTSTTVFSINQTPYIGGAGLAALKVAGTTTAVVARGSYSFTSHRFIATEVDAGSSVPGGTLDAADGVVLSRSGSTVVLRGATLNRVGQAAFFADDVSITLGTGTRVREEGSPKGTFDISDISVGQHLVVFGTLTDTTPGSLALDASAGFASLRYTRFDGTVVTAPNGSGSNVSMAVDVQFMQGRPVSLFDFTGTGAVPSNFVVSMPSLVSGINVSDPVRVWGFVTPFGSAPPDFAETSVADYVDGRSDLAVAWAKPGSVDAFSSLSATSGIVVNLASSPVPFQAKVEQGGIVTPLVTSPTVDGSFGVFAILQGGVVTVHLSYARFITDLDTRLGAGASARFFFARGGYTSSTTTLKAREVAVILQ